MADGFRGSTPSRAARTGTRQGSLASWLPRGNMLRPATFAHRHGLITHFALVQALLLGVAGMLLEASLASTVMAVLVPGVPALLGLARSLPRRMAMLSTVVSLMLASAALVDLTGGLIEAHFHFFVMLGVVSLYQDWSAFGMCVAVTVLHHAAMGVASPSSVFAGADREAAPVRWAVIHGAFILAASVTHMISWKLNEQQELRDPLTQLPNRTSFVEHLTSLLRISDQPVAVLFVDLDDFKEVNDTAGHHVGDAVIVRAAQAMTASVREDDLVARLGGDEFAVVIAGDAALATGMADRISRSIGRPVSLDGREIFLTASIGVADNALAGSREPEALLRDADLAMYLAKSGGRNRVVVYDEGVDRAVRDQADLARDMESALEREELELHYQPVVRGEDIVGVEALLRWNHPQRGRIAPDVFIPIAEQSGAIKPIGAWVLRTAAVQVARWQREVPGCADLELAVNLSVVQMRDPELLPLVAETIRSSGLDPDHLIVEVTETMLLADLDAARRQLDAIRALGVQVAIDDFGTGYSSLSYLARLPADQVKIDRSFIRELGSGPRSVALVRSILEMASALNLDVQAEGVEEVSQRDILDGLGCNRAQGFLFSRPLAGSDFVAFMGRYAAVAAAADTAADALAASAHPALPAGTSVAPVPADDRADDRAGARR